MGKFSFFNPECYLASSFNKTLMTFLDFEKPVEELIDQIEKQKQIGEKSKIDVSKTIAALE